MSSAYTNDHTTKALLKKKEYIENLLKKIPQHHKSTRQHYEEALAQVLENLKVPENKRHKYRKGSL